MNAKKLYEELITSRLEAIPLPDMADAIWQRIETRLDLELPSDDAPDAPPQNPGGGWIGGASLLLVVGAIITYFLITQKPETPIVNPSLPNTQQQLQQAPANNSNTNNPNNTTTLPSTSNPNNAPPNTATQQQQIPAGNPSAPNNLDSALTQPLTNLPAVDSSHSLTQSAPPPANRPDSIGQKKKGKGVRLNDQDYRIVPTRDSN